MLQRLLFSAVIFSAFFLTSVAHAREFVWNGSSDLVGGVERASIEENDTLYDVGMKHDIGFIEMQKANPGIDAWLPEPSAELVIPSEFVLPSIREGVVINLREYRLYFFPADSDKVITYPVGIGAEESPSPVISTRVKLKIEKPNWYPPESAREDYFKEHGEVLARIVYPGPSNPLGPFAIQLELPEYFIHGTNKAFGIGTRVSRGCIRLDNDDLSKFVWEVPKYTPVRIIKEPIKVGMREDALYIELHLDDEPNLDQDEIVARVIERVGELEKSAGLLKIDFLALKSAIEAPTGLPQKIGIKKAGSSKASLAMSGK